MMRSLGRIPAGWLRGLAVVVAFSLGSLLVLSCRTVNRATVMLPNVPGLTYIGSKECETCHQEIYQNFKTADHALLTLGGPNALNAGCESCHGPSSAHSESGGEIKPPNSFTAGRPAANTYGANLTTPPFRATDTVCYQCHADVRGQFNLPSHHPVPEGRMSCMACHSPHKGFAHVGGSTALRSQDATCLQCHPNQRGPYVFEHEAMHEGCTSCHGAHGTVNAKMLTVRDANLCLKCHFQKVQGGNIVIGGAIHSGAINRLSQGTCWTAGCHEAVHGSRVNSSLRF
jgi:predicted CXXCH cytochrome family protein